MKLSLRDYLVVAIISVLVAGFALVLFNRPERALGSVTIGNEYFATTTNAQASFNNYTVLRGRFRGYPTSTPTVLGSVVITTTGTSPMCLYDATSTVTNAEWATSTIACFPASATVGTYQFDAQYNKGILIEFTGAGGTTRASSTITFR